MLNKASTKKYINILVEQGVILDIHKKVWRNARPYLAHGGIIDYTKTIQFWHYRNH